jgi:hypothetical protein
MKIQQILEALKPSQYRNLVKGWDKSKYADLFNNKYRIYIPLGEKVKDVKPNSEVESFVKSQGYEIEDYLTGIASKDNGKRKVRIGKLLTKEPDLKKLFDNDSSRNSSQSEYIVVISRHPYDIAGMSTDRGWTSCMNLVKQKYTANHSEEFVPLDIKEGTLVAYLIKNTDKNIESPSARVLIKPFINLDGSEDIAFGVEDKVYGTAPEEFQQTVVDWADNINKKKKLNGIFELNQKVYNNGFDFNDQLKPFGNGVGSEEYLKRKLEIDGDYIGDIKDPSETLQIIAVAQYAPAIRLILNPSEKVQMEAVRKNGMVLEYIIKNGITPTENVQLEAVKKSGKAIKYLVDNNITPSENVIISAIKQNSEAFGYLKTPSEKIQELAVSLNPSYTLTVLNMLGIQPSEKIQEIILKQDARLYAYIKNPSPASKEYYEAHR